MPTNRLELTCDSRSSRTSGVPSPHSSRALALACMNRAVTITGAAALQRNCPAPRGLATLLFDELQAAWLVTSEMAPLGRRAMAWNRAVMFRGRAAVLGETLSMSSPIIAATDTV